MALRQLGTAKAGDEVYLKLKAGGTAPYIVLQQGKPDWTKDTRYNTWSTGTVLFPKYLDEKGALDTETEGKKVAKARYFTSNEVGVSARHAESSSDIVDGAVFAYFKEKGAAGRKRTIKSGTARTWSTNTLVTTHYEPDPNNSNIRYGISASVSLDTNGYTYYGAGSYMPQFFVLPQAMYLTEDNVVTVNHAPGQPPYIDVPERFQIYRSAKITWGAASDEDGGKISYALQRSVNGGGYADIYKGLATDYTDADIHSGVNTVRYRVRAEDEEGAASSYIQSATRTVVHNVSPTMSGEDHDLGALTEPPEIAFTVDDQDAGDTLCVAIELDGQPVWSLEGAVRGEAYGYALTRKEFLSLADGPHSIVLRVWDDLGDEAARTITFSRSVQGIDYTCWHIPTESRPTQVLGVLQYYAPEECVSLEFCNNFQDEEPVWERAYPGRKIFFTNAEKVAEAWQVAARVVIRGAAGVSVVSQAIKVAYKVEV